MPQTTDSRPAATERDQRFARGSFNGRMAMTITPERVVYAGLLGAITQRTLGSLTLYIARDIPFTITIGDQPPRQAYWAAVPPNVPHVIQSNDRVVWDVLIEPECVDIEDFQRQFPQLLSTPTESYLRIRGAFERWIDGIETFAPSAEAIDRFFFGQPLKARRLDERIKCAVEQIRAHSCEQYFAAECARLTGLSFSRFVHLFKEQIGMTFRTFCAWKRARALLPYVTSASNLTDLALKMGYPDSTHFSHSIRRIYGLRPRDILAGSRRLTLQFDAPSTAEPSASELDTDWREPPRRTAGFVNRQTALRSHG